MGPECMVCGGQGQLIGPKEHEQKDRKVSEGPALACRLGVRELGKTRGRNSVQELEESSGVATHSSTLAWKIPWTEEPGRLQSMGS